MKTKRKLMPGEIMTFSGKIVDPLNPDPEQISIIDIAHSLANQCRFTGHTKLFYSVAQHSVEVSLAVQNGFENPSDDLLLWGLLHDGTEAYLSDIARPIKRAKGLGDIYREVEEGLMEAICEAFALPYEMPEEVHWADNVLLRSEMRDLMPEGMMDSFENDGDILDHKLIPREPYSAEFNFLHRYKEIA